MREFNVSILGEQWEVRIRKEHECELLSECDGFCDWTSRMIVVSDGIDESTLRFPEEYMRKVLRHEIIHAFMHESGRAETFWECCGEHMDEIATDWIAIQLPKIEKSIAEAEGKLKMLLEGEERDGTGKDPAIC